MYLFNPGSIIHRSMKAPGVQFAVFLMFVRSMI